MAIAAYLVWGLLPLYLRLVHSVPPLAFVGWRTVFTLPVCLVLVALRRQGSELVSALIAPRALAMLALSSALIGGNWLIFVSAIQAGHLFATSLGYYINPLVNILLGTALLGEKLSRRQWLAVALAGSGVLLLALAGGGEAARQTLGISLALAATFSAYGLVRKLVPVGSLPGLTIEASLLLGPAIAILALTGHKGDAGFGQDVALSALIALAGLVTAVPLLLFAEAARRMDYSTLGFVQFISPTTVFLLGFFVFHEPLRPAQLASFVAIWCALAVFCWDLWIKRRPARTISSPRTS